MPIHVNGSGQPLHLPEMTSSPTVQVPVSSCREEAEFKGRNMRSLTVVSVSILYTPLLPLSLLVARTSLLSSQLAVLMMTFFPLLTSPPVFLTLLPSGPWTLPPGARVRLNRLLLHPYLVRRPFPFPSFLHLLLNFPLSLLFLVLPPSSRPYPLFFRH